MRDYERLRVWQEPMDVTATVYRLTRSRPDSELYGLVSQLRRASVAVVSNIAEGVGRSTQRDFARLIAMASGSAAEVSTQLQLVQRLHGLDCDAAQQQVRAVSKMLRSFHARLSSDLDPSS